MEERRMPPMKIYISTERWAEKRRLLLRQRGKRSFAFRLRKIDDGAENVPANIMISQGIISRN